MSATTTSFNMAQFANNLLAGPVRKARPVQRLNWQIKDDPSDQRAFAALDSEAAEKINRSFKQPEVEQDDIDSVIFAQGETAQNAAAARIGRQIAAAYLAHRNEQVDRIEIERDAANEGDRWDAQS